MWICLPGSHITASLQYQQSVIKTGRRVWSAAWDCFWRIWGWSSRTKLGRWVAGYMRDHMCHGQSIARFFIKRDGHPCNLPQGCSMLAPQRALHVEPELQRVPRCNGRMDGASRLDVVVFFTMDLYGINPFTLLLKWWSIFIMKGYLILGCEASPQY